MESMKLWYGMLILVENLTTYHMHRKYPLLQNISATAV
jgi:hypothetical protein